MTSRCEKHKIFIGKDGCKICNEMQSLRNEYHAKCHELIVENNKLEKENETIKLNLIDQANESIKLGKEKCRLEQELSIFNNELGFENDQLRAGWKRDKEHILNLEGKIKQLESKELPTDVKEAITYLSRNEKPIFTNLFAAESIVASIWDLYLKIPEKRRNSIKPLSDYILSIADQMNVLDTEIATKAVKSMGANEYNNLIVETIRVLDVSAGKIKNCETCIHALERKELIKKEIKNGKV